MTDLQTALKPHDKTLDTLVDAAAQRDQPTFLAATGRLLAEIATDLPIVGKLVQTGLSAAFARSAWAQMERALADAHTEDARRAQLTDMGGVFAALLGQGLAALVNHQDAQHDAVLAAVGGLRDDLTEFRADVRQQAHAVHIDFQDVQGGLGFRVGPDAGRSVFIKHQRVGPGGVGFEI